MNQMNVSNTIPEPASDEALRHVPRHRVTQAFRWIGDDLFLYAVAKQRKTDKVYSKSIGRNLALARLRKVASNYCNAQLAVEVGSTVANFVQVIQYKELKPMEQLLVRKLVPRDQREQFAPRVPDEALGD